MRIMLDVNPNELADYRKIELPSYVTHYRILDNCIIELFNEETTVQLYPNAAWLKVYGTGGKLACPIKTIGLVCTVVDRAVNLDLAVWHEAQTNGQLSYFTNLATWQGGAYNLNGFYDGACCDDVDPIDFNIL